MKEITENYASYETLIDSFEVETLLMEAIGDYQGDYFVLLKDTNRYGYLVFGYGSCSGCDVLEASYGDASSITMLRNELWASVSWKTLSEMIEYFEAKDEKLEWWGHNSDYDAFKASALELLRS